MSLKEEELYNRLFEEICNSDLPKYDTMVIFVHNLLYKIVKSWCYNDPVLGNGGYYDDIMQEIQIRIIKKCEKSFFYSEKYGPDKSCEAFKAWCFRVAKNYFNTYYSNSRKHLSEELNLTGIYDTKDLFGERDDLVEDHNNIKKVFSVVMGLKSSAHIILTWLAVSFFILSGNLNRIEATHFLVEKFSDCKMFAMFDIIVSAVGRFKWMELSETQIHNQREKLKRLSPETGKLIGEMKYSDFYMSKGPEKSVSDWINRINAQIKKKL